MNYLPLLALLAGAAIAIQAAFNAQLGVLLDNSLLGTSVAFLIAFVCTVTLTLFSTQHYPAIHHIKAVPLQFWFVGGALSALGVSLFYYLIPKMGLGPMMSFALSGQILVATLASHYSWFNLPANPINSLKLVGVAALVVGLFFINWEPGYAHAAR